MSTKAEIIERLNLPVLIAELIPSVKPTGAELSGLCPFHDDQAPSMSVNPITGLFQCHACGKSGSIFDLFGKVHGLDFPASIKTLTARAGLAPGKGSISNATLKPTEVDRHDYHDVSGNLLYQRVRFEPSRDGMRKKEYMPFDPAAGQWKRPGAPVLYHLPDVVNASTVIICEGERKADVVQSWGLVGTCFDSGANSTINSAMVEVLSGKELIILPDNDDPGRIHRDNIIKAMLRKAASIKVIDLPGLAVKGDIVDWIKTPGNDKARLLELVAQAQEWEWSPAKNGDEFSKTEPNRPTAFKKIISMADLVNKEFAPIRWVIPGLLPEGLAILSGPPKIGKSWLVMNLCLATAWGGYVFGRFKVDPGSVLLLSLEDNERRLKGRLEICTAGNKQNLANYHATTEWRRLDQGGLTDLSEWLDQHSDCKLVVIDTMQKIKPHPTRKSGNAYENDYEAYGDLQRMALQCCICILVIHHNRKSESKAPGDPLEMISGSIGITGAMDTILMLSRPRGAAGAVLTATGRDIPESEYGMVFDGVTGQWIISGRPEELMLKEGSHTSSILEFLKEHSGKEFTGHDVFEGIGEEIKIATVKRELNRLVSKSIIQRHLQKYSYHKPAVPVSPVSLVPNRISTTRDTKDTEGHGDGTPQSPTGPTRDTKDTIYNKFLLVEDYSLPLNISTVSTVSPVSMDEDIPDFDF